MTKPLVDPDLSNETVGNAIVVTATAVKPFIPPKVRAGIYTVAGIASVTALAVAPVVGGTIGAVFAAVGAGAGALASALALSNVSTV